MEALNYFRKAYTDIKNESLYLKMGSPTLSAQVENVLALGLRCQKFILPQGGRIIDNDLDGLPDNINLPFPEILIEYSIKPNGKISPAEKIFTKEGSYGSSKRIAVAQQLEVNGPIVVFSLAFNDDSKNWEIFPYAQVNLKNVSTNIEINPVIDKLFKDNNIRQFKVGSYGCYSVPFDEIPKYVPDWQERACVDLADENRAVLELVQALSCSNVSTDTIVARKTNKQAKKSKSDSLPFNDYHVLVIRNNNKANSNSEKGCNKSSPREHLRRGHIRTYENGNKVWVQSCIVNPGTTGRIDKDYKL
jgi:hypothetical protein